VLVGATRRSSTRVVVVVVGVTGEAGTTKRVKVPP
jgi:hypothetical protein